MQDIVARTEEAIRETQAIVDRVCGSCENSCCHQGTMMGTHDVLRLAKGTLLEEGREERLRAGLRARAAELRADLATLRNVRRLLAAAAQGNETDLANLDAALAAWEAFCETLEGSWDCSVGELRSMLRFAGIWAVTLRALGVFPGGHAALSTLAQAGSSFRFRGRRLAPPRCLFHSLAAGCLAGPWKPGKCANFFCAGVPNVLEELRAGLSFDDFVLGNAMVIPADRALEPVRVELALGREFVEPKVYVGLTPDARAALRELLAGAFGKVSEPLARAERFLLSTLESEAVVPRPDSDEVCWVEAQVIDGFALYELAVALDRHRAAAESVPLVVVAEEYVPLSSMPHPLWGDAEMSQPLGVLDLYVVAPPIASP